MTMSLNVSAFDMAHLHTDVNVAVVMGRRGAGKTHMLKHMMRLLVEQGITRFAIFTPTVGDWQSNVHEPTIENLRRSWEDQKNFARDASSHLVIMMDSCGFKKQIMNSSVMHDILHNARFHHTTLLISITNTGDLTPALRHRVDAFFMFTSDIQSELAKVHDAFFYFLYTPSILSKVLKAVDSDDHTALVAHAGHAFHYKAV